MSKEILEKDVPDGMVFELDPPEKANPKVRPDIDTSGLHAKELEMAEKLGIVKKDKKPDEKKEETPADKSAEKKDEKKEEIKPEIKEDIKAEINKDKSPEEEHDFITKLSPKEKAFYYEMKDNKRKRQFAQQERDLLKIKLSESQKEIELLKKEKPKPELDEFGNLVEPKKEFITKEELAEQNKERTDRENEARLITERTRLLENGAREKDPDFENVVKNAQQYMNADKSGVFSARFVSLCADTSNDGDEVIAYVYNLAKLNGYEKPKETPKEEPKAEEKKEEPKAEDVKKIDKMLENAGRVSSASIGSGGRRLKGEDELTPADVANFTSEQYSKLSRKTKDRILKESCG